MTSISDFSGKLKEQMAADRKKTIALFALAVVLLVLVGRLFLSDGAPAPAQADEALAVSTSTEPPPRRSLKRPVPEQTVALDARTSRGRPRPTASPRFASSSSEPPVSVTGLPRTMARDLFSTSAWDEFPSEASSEPPVTDAEPPTERGPGFLEQLSKRLAERKAARKEAMAALLAEAQALELQSTMTGQVSSAYISGRLVHEGGTIAGFLVVRIEDRRVTLERSGVRHVLTMP